MAGDTSSLSPILAASVENAALGSVSRTAVAVTQLVATPVADVVQPGGKAGAVTLSKFCVKTLAIRPSWKEAVATPRFAGPSWSWSVAVIVPPQAPVAEKLNGWLTAEPPATSTP